MTLRAHFTDIGGCLCPDVLDHVSACLLTRFPASSHHIQEAKTAFWNQYAYGAPGIQGSDGGMDEMETQAWAQFARMAQIEVPPEELISISAECIQPLDARYIALLRCLHDDGVTVGIISNNISFIFERQREALGLDDTLIPPEQVILSCDYGVPKRSEKSTLFSAAVRAAGVSPQNCAFADDRPHNVAAALRAGFGMAILHPRNVAWGAEYVGRILSQAGWISGESW